MIIICAQNAPYQQLPTLKGAKRAVGSQQISEGGGANITESECL